MDTINFVDPYRVFYTIWLFAKAASLIYLGWDARGRLHLGLGAWFVWSLFLLGTGPVGLVFYWIAFKDIRRMPEGTNGEMTLTTWRAALAASTARASVYMLWFFYSLLFIIFVVAETGSPLVTLILIYFLAFLIFWLISSITFKSRTGTSFWISMRSSFVTEYTALNLVFVGTLLTNLVLERVLPVLYADATHPVFWMRASISGFMGLLLYYPYAFWLRSGNFYDWSALAAVEPHTMDTSTGFPGIRESGAALMVSIVLLAASLMVIVFVL